MKQNQKGSSSLLIIIGVIAILAVAGFYLLRNKTATPSYQSNQPSIQQTTSTIPTVTQTNSTVSVPEVKSAQDLTTVSNGLDNTNIDSALDPELNQNETDAQTFAPRIRLKNGTSTNWTGYAVETNLVNPQNYAVSDVKGSWIVPSLICNGTNTYSAAWVGIDGYSDNTVEQTGTEHDCISGQPRYYAWYEMYPKPSFRIKLPVKAGDTISAEVQYINNKFVLTLANITTGQSFSTNQKSNSLRQSAEWIMEAPWSGGVLPLTNFGTIPFNNASVIINGHAGTISDTVWKNDAIAMMTSSGTPKATPSLLSSDGSGFSVFWNSN